MKTVLQAVAQYWKKLDKPLLFAAMLCSALSVVLLHSIYINHAAPGVVVVAISFSW